MPLSYPDHQTDPNNTRFTLFYMDLNVDIIHLSNLNIVVETTLINQ